MISRENLAELRATLDDGAVEQHPPFDVDGAGPTVTLRPADGDALARAIGALGRRGLAALVRGGGSRLGLGNPPRRADVILSTERLAGVDEFDPGEGVCRVRAGTSLAAARAVVNPQGWELPLDPPGAGATAGGTIAAAAVGPRAQGFGLPRDLVLGLEVTLGSGERTRCGGRVVKNATGYDLSKLYTGSFGTLGVIEGAWLRLRPVPERTAVLEARLADLEGACSRAVAAARRGSARAAALDAPATGGGCRVVVELAGGAAGVEQDAAWLEREIAAREAPEEALDRVRGRQVSSRDALRFRIAALPSRLEGAVARLREAGAAVLAYPGLASIYAGFRLASGAGESEVGAIWQGVVRVARDAGGHFVCEAAPTWAKRGRDVFGAPSAALALSRAIKSRFDPLGVLNPGRFAGGL